MRGHPCALFASRRAPTQPRETAADRNCRSGRTRTGGRCSATVPSRPSAETGQQRNQAQIRTSPKRRRPRMVRKSLLSRTRKEGPIASRAAPSLQDSSFADAASRSRRSAFPSSSFARSSNVARSPPWIRVSASLRARRACPRRSLTCLNKLSFDFWWSTQVNAMWPRTLQSHPPPDSQARLPAVPIMRSDR